jgi:hypothetical protein
MVEERAAIGTGEKCRGSDATNLPSDAISEDRVAVVVIGQATRPLLLGGGHMWQCTPPRVISLASRDRLRRYRTRGLDLDQTWIRFRLDLD